MASIISATTTNGLSTSADNSGSLQLATNNGTTAVTIDTSQNVGIGTATPTTVANKNLQVYSGSGASAVVRVTGNAGTGFDFLQGTDGIAYVWNRDNTATLFGTNNAERMRIDSSGNLLVGCTSGGYTSSILTLSLDNSTKWVTGPGAGIATRFYVSASASGGVYLNGTSATTWTAISDERFKTNLTPILDGLNKVNSLRAVTGTLKNDELQTSKSFLIAQDVLKVLPEAVDTTDPECYGLAYTDVIPLLVAAIQELKAELDATKAEVQALKGVA